MLVDWKFPRKVGGPLGLKVICGENFFLARHDRTRESSFAYNLLRLYTA
jgi:hypothetical protein